ncbi:hypothetical protein DXG01_007063, partial [Tephrocybe rancida]
MAHNPLATITRNVLRYPANGEEPHITSMEFSEAGAKHRHGFYTTAVDLRSTYGRYLQGGIRAQMLGVENQPNKDLEGEYSLYYNLDARLPLNLAMARVAKINPKNPGPWPTWRGDVVVVKHRWPEKFVIGGGAHMHWLDVSEEVRQIVDMFVVKWYSSDQWREKVRDERETAEAAQEFD